MSHWPFILGAYAAALAGTLAVAASSYLAMRRAEREAESLGGGR